MVVDFYLDAEYWFAAGSQTTPPRVGESVRLGEMSGRVKDVLYDYSDSVLNVLVSCESVPQE